MLVIFKVGVSLRLSVGIMFDRLGDEIRKFDSDYARDSACDQGRWSVASLENPGH